MILGKLIRCAVCDEFPAVDDFTWFGCEIGSALPDRLRWLLGLGKSNFQYDALGE